MKRRSRFLQWVFSLFSLTLAVEGGPELFSQYLSSTEFVKGSVGVVLPPESIEPYVKKVEAAARLDPEWFRDYSRQSDSGVPLPYHEKLGLTRAEYDRYIAEWKKRSFKEIEPVALRLEKSSDGDWMIRATGPGFAISSLRYNEETKQLISPNGEMKRIKDVELDELSLLGAWKGHEWVHESETSLARTRENFAIGKKVGEPVGYLIYRLQEISTKGRKLYDKRLIIRFPIQK